MVRLKEFDCKTNKNLKELFQFLMVRLKAIDLTALQQWKNDFNSLWCD